MRAGRWTVCVALVAMCLSAGCGSGERDDGPRPPADSSSRDASPAGESPGQEPGEEKPSGPAVTVTDGEGYRFEVVGMGAGTVPEIGEENGGEAVSARPGHVFVHVDVAVRNLRKDRSAPLGDVLTHWRIDVPRSAAPEGNTLRQCDSYSEHCADRISCLRTDAPPGEDGDMGGLDEKNRTIPAGATWRLRCFLGQSTFASVSGAKEVRDSVDPGRIRLLRVEDAGGFTVEESGIDLEIPLG
ncbi:hypothetical protein [Streptomyces sp. enrichment culture]|uniref:hypothetical protein n=1 Tax=Streptomyces sp. enrichment culture TaxID=1795815 RepID=UPI003F55E607